MCLVEVCAYMVMGEELILVIVLRIQVEIVWRDGRFLISWYARQASTSTSDPCDSDTKGL